MALIEAIIGAIMFVLTAGLLGRERFAKNPILMSLVVILSVGSTIGSVYFLKDWVLALVDERYNERRASERVTHPTQSVGPRPDEQTIELEFWRSISGSRNPEEYREYLRRYPQGRFVHIARERIKELTSLPPSESPSAGAMPSQPSAAVQQEPPSALSDALVIGDLSHPEQSPEPFPRERLMYKLRNLLKGVPTKLKRIEFAVAFIEPREFRSRAYGGTIYGFIAGSIPLVPDCFRQFGVAKLYNTSSVQAGIALAIEEQAPRIAEWLKEADAGNSLRCPN